MDAKARDRPIILVADGDARTARMLAQMLREDGYRAHVAVDGPTAIGWLARDPAPDVLVSDLRLPEVDGLAVMRYARSRRADLPIFVVTGNPHLLPAGRPLDPPALIFTKPLDYDAFLAMLGRVVPNGAR
jgi:CheY-like chemotaxis protein